MIVCQGGYSNFCDMFGGSLAKRLLSSIKRAELFLLISIPKSHAVIYKYPHTKTSSMFRDIEGVVDHLIQLRDSGKSDS